MHRVARAFEALAASLGGRADLVWMQMPGDQAPHLREASLAAFAVAAREAIGQAFGTRPVLLAGQGMGATLALAVQAPTVSRILAIEPELSPSTAWPVLPTFRKIYRAGEADSGYIRDQNVFRDGITIPDQMSLNVRYRTGEVLTYSLVCYSPREGMRVTFNGDRGRLEYYEFLRAPVLGRRDPAPIPATDRADFDAWRAKNPEPGFAVAWDPAGKAWAEGVTNTAFGVGMFQIGRAHV